MTFPKLCQYPNCSNLTKRIYCEDHSDYTTNKPRASAHKRGYDARWRRYRKYFLSKNPLCITCGRIATVVDHIKPHKGSYDLFWDIKNHQSMCKVCHDRKTATEDMDAWDTQKGLQ